MKYKEIKIVIVEDDLYYNKALTKYIQTICNEKVFTKFSFDIKSYTSAHDCIEELEDDLDILLLDYYLINLAEHDVLTGADVIDAVKENCADCEIVMISSQTDPDITSNLKSRGINEYIDKNLNSKNRIGSVIQKIIHDKQLIA